MEVRELDFTELQRLKSFEWWTDRNNFSKVTKDVRSGFIHVYAVIKERKVIATLKMSGKVTVLGREIAQAAAQIYGVTVADTVDNYDEVSSKLVSDVLGILKGMGYKQVVVTHSESNDRTRNLCNKFGITDVLGNIIMEGGKGVPDKYVIVRGNITGK